ncbi:MAG: 3-ketoacyl-ACP reductase [Cryomorphaceae bacterium]|nr:MAG: 3-ketoacyl-ACP reductase [Cryomorphaceae bacterium]
MELKNKNILLTGGSSGIGKKTAEMLVEKGAKVLITGRSYDKIETIKQHLGVLGVSFDISDIENIAIKTDECVELLGGRVDVLINNAGIGEFGPLDKIDVTSFLEVFNTNVFGLALLTKELIPVMKKQSQGTIINIGSSASIRGFKNGSVYAASKFAVRALSQCWQAELRPHNIRVCQVNPSEVTTAFAQKDRKERADLDHKLSPKEIAHTIISIIEMRNKGFVPEVNIWATNPF